MSEFIASDTVPFVYLDSGIWATNLIRKAGRLTGPAEYKQDSSDYGDHIEYGMIMQSIDHRRTAVLRRGDNRILLYTGFDGENIAEAYSNSEFDEGFRWGNDDFAVDWNETLYTTISLPPVERSHFQAYIMTRDDDGDGVKTMGEQSMLFVPVRPESLILYKLDGNAFPSVCVDLGVYWTGEADDHSGGEIVNEPQGEVEDDDGSGDVKRKPKNPDEELDAWLAKAADEDGDS